ncbi:hypothetical protein GGX14DRAFT_397088 [Mycena pura]|uniref:RING-type domain-containing protein n=1 Tax=Mycena pura TaxID=153505 RepID=A0AAD6VCT0_9AGAR|nr:hypothetical protein GGX14DRAFT_397088 [Mycena pura]
MSSGHWTTLGEYRVCCAGSAALTPAPSRIDDLGAEETVPGRVRREPSEHCGIWCVPLSATPFVSRRELPPLLSFEHPVRPIQTPCCSHFFCAEHITAWLHGPASDGLCAVCRVPTVPSHTSSPSPARSASLCSTTSTDSVTPASSDSDSFDAQSPSSSASECEDTTDYSFPALQRTRALQGRRHASHPFDSVLGVRGAMRALVRAAGLLVWSVLYVTHWVYDYEFTSQAMNLFVDGKNCIQAVARSPSNLNATGNIDGEVRNIHVHIDVDDVVRYRNVVDTRAAVDMTESGGSWGCVGGAQAGAPAS